MIESGVSPLIFSGTRVAHYPNGLNADAEPPLGYEVWVMRPGQRWPEDQIADGYYPFILFENEFRMSRQRVEEPSSERRQNLHSFLAEGQDVIAAGMVGIKDGKVMYISNRSGHYKPEPTSLLHVSYALYQLRAPMAEEVEFKIFTKVSRPDFGFFKTRLNAVLRTGDVPVSLSA